MFNREMLILAREFMGDTQKDLAEKLNITQAHLSRLEAGIHDISEDIINQLVNISDFNKSFFEQDKEHYGLPLSVNGNFRKRQAVTKKTYLKIKSLINIVIYNIEDLVKINNMNSKLPDILKQINYESSNKKNDITNEETKEISDKDKSSIKEIISILKKDLKIDINKPVINIVKNLEEQNILVIEVDFGTELVDGFSYWVGEMPVIFVSSKIPGDRQRFTILHELGHLVLHKNYINEQMEKEADFFASEFLMPEKEIENDLYYLTLEKLAALKLKWQVSMASLLIKAKSLQTIDENRYRGLWISLSKAGYRKVEPIQINREETSIMKNLICNLGDKIEETIKLKTNKIKEIYNL